jgi:hypothetical protein
VTLETHEPWRSADSARAATKSLPVQKIADSASQNAHSGLILIFITNYCRIA